MRMRTKPAEKCSTEPMLVNALFWEYRSSATVCIPHYTPRGWYECDLFVVMRSGLTVECEIKMNRADFLADARKSDRVYGAWDEASLATPFTERRKHERLAVGDEHGPSRFWFVVPNGVVEPHEVPLWAGLRVARGGTLTVVRSAPLLREKPTPERRQELCSDIRRACYWRYWSMRRDHAGNTQ